SAHFSPDGRTLVTTSDDMVSTWALDEKNPQPHTLARRDGVDANSAEYSPDGKRILTAWSDGSARELDAQTGKVLRTYRHGHRVTGATYSPNGSKILTIGSDAIGRLWDASRPTKPLYELRGHSSWLSGGAFSPNGRFAATTSIDGTTRVWDAATGDLLSIQ